MSLPMLPQDKINHYLYGQLVFAVTYFITLNTMYGLLASVAVGVLKEVADYVLNKKAKAAGLPAPHGVEALDAVATAAGGLVPFILLGI